MSVVAYRAKRSLITGHELGDLIDLVIKVRDAVRSRTVRKYVNRSSGGGTETIYEGADTQWALEFGPIRARDLPIAREYADSTAGGEPFDLAIFADVIDSETATLSLRRTDQSYQFLKMRNSPDPGEEIYTLRMVAIEA
jgi:hypothetical protein